MEKPLFNPQKTELFELLNSRIFKIISVTDRVVIDWLIDVLIDGLIDWLIDGLIDWLIDWLMDGSMDWLIDRWVGWLIDWFWLIIFVFQESCAAFAEYGPHTLCRGSRPGDERFRQGRWEPLNRRTGLPFSDGQCIVRDQLRGRRIPTGLFPVEIGHSSGQTDGQLHPFDRPFPQWSPASHFTDWNWFPGHAHRGNGRRNGHFFDDGRRAVGVRCDIRLLAVQCFSFPQRRSHGVAFYEGKFFAWVEGRQAFSRVISRGEKWCLTEGGGKVRLEMLSIFLFFLRNFFSVTFFVIFCPIVSEGWLFCSIKVLAMTFGTPEKSQVTSVELRNVFRFFCAIFRPKMFFFQHLMVSKKSFDEKVKKCTLYAKTFWILCPESSWIFCLKISWVLCPKTSWILCPETSWIFCLKISWVLCPKTSWILCPETSWIFCLKISWVLCPKTSWIFYTETFWILVKKTFWIFCLKISWVLYTETFWILWKKEIFCWNSCVRPCMS